jgi:predicted nucleic acid-binding protein
MKGARVFVDTNVLVYAHDRSAGKKHETARDVVLDLWESGMGVLSMQVLQEFFTAVTRKIAKPMASAAARQIIEDLLKWSVVVNDGDSILAAIDILDRYKLSFWDSMIVQAAVRGGADVLLSEDLSDGQTIHGVRISNPFR